MNECHIYQYNNKMRNGNHWNKKFAIPTQRKTILASDSGGWGDAAPSRLKFFPHLLY